MTGGAVAAVDLGASNGRVILGVVSPTELTLHEARRFPNDPVALPDGLHWDVLRLQHEVTAGLRAAGRLDPGLASVGIDSWAIDYALLDEAGRLIENPYHYRDPRSAAGVASVDALIPRDRLYARTGLQFLPFNTIYQLAASAAAPSFAAARHLLLVPDLLGYWLAGAMVAEETNASTTGLFAVRERAWADDLIADLGLPRAIFPPHRRPGDVAGPLRADVLAETGLAPSTMLTHVGSHDTASAIVAVPAADERFAYISCGTWSLVGVELAEPILSEAGRAANFTNEAGVDGRVRYLRNVMGLWLLQESMRAWERAGFGSDLEGLIEAASSLPAGGPVFDPDDAVFLPPGDMPARIAEACRRAGSEPPTSRPAIVRATLDSLALAYARTLRAAVDLSGTSVTTIHVVGGGSNNRLLCQLTADACGLPVVAGPVEATAIGNILVQARAHEFVSGDLEALRALVRATQPLRRFEPRPALSAGTA